MVAQIQMIQSMVLIDVVDCFTVIPSYRHTIFILSIAYIEFVSISGIVCFLIKQKTRVCSIAPLAFCTFPSSFSHAGFPLALDSFGCYIA